MNNKIKLLKKPKVSSFVLLQILYTGITSVLNIFINTFLLKSFGGTSTEVLVYNLVSALTMPVAMITAVTIARKTKPLVTQRLGFVFYVLVSVLLSVFVENAAPYYLLFSILISFGSAYYFAIYSRQMVSYIENESRDFICGIVSLLGTVVALILPLISGYLMTKFGFLGYKIMFGVEATFAALALLTTKWLAPVRQSEIEGTGGVISVAKIILKNPNGLKVMIANGIDNCRSFTIVFYITVLIYKAINDEFLVSINSAIGSTLTLLGALFYCIIVNTKSRYTVILVAITVIALACIPMIFTVSSVTIMFFSAINSLCSMYVSTPITNSYFLYMDRTSQLRGNEMEAHCVREFFVTLGRVFGIALIFLIPQNNYGIVITLLIMILGSGASGMMLKKVGRSMLVPEN